MPAYRIHVVDNTLALLYNSSKSGGLTHRLTRNLSKHVQAEKKRVQVKEMQYRTWDAQSQRRREEGERCKEETWFSLDLLCWMKLSIWLKVGIEYRWGGSRGTGERRRGRLATRITLVVRNICSYGKNTQQNCLSRLYAYALETATTFSFNMLQLLPLWSLRLSCRSGNPFFLLDEDDVAIVGSFGNAS